MDEALQYEVHRVDQGAVEVEEHVLLAGHLGVLLFARSVGGFFLGFLAGKQTETRGKDGAFYSDDAGHVLYWDCCHSANSSIRLGAEGL